MKNKEFFISQLDTILKEYDSLVSSAQYDDLSDIKNYVEMDLLITKSKAAIERITGKGSEYYKSIQIAYTEKRTYYTKGLILKQHVGIVRALYDDLSKDYLRSISELIHSEVFSDYLEMASYLVNEGYKDPAAVIAGSTLESHLRNLCQKSSIKTDFQNNKGRLVPKKADTLNTDLFKAEVYNRTLHKQIIAWFDLRNNAAHGKYNEYTEEDVKLMISGITNFIISYLA